MSGTLKITIEPEELFDIISQHYRKEILEAFSGAKTISVDIDVDDIHPLTMIVTKGKE